jgi:hypothetical protein
VCKDRRHLFVTHCLQSSQKNTTIQSRVIDRHHIDANPDPDRTLNIIHYGNMNFFTLFSQQSRVFPVVVIGIINSIFWTNFFFIFSRKKYSFSFPFS